MYKPKILQLYKFFQNNFVNVGTSVLQPSENNNLAKIEAIETPISSNFFHIFILKILEMCHVYGTDSFILRLYIYLAKVKKKEPYF